MAEEFNKQPACLNTDKYITCTVLIEKEVKIIDENGEEITKNISYRLHFIDSTIFMASSLSNLVKSSLGIHRIKYVTDMMIKIVKLSELNINIATFFLNTQTLKII